MLQKSIPNPCVRNLWASHALPVPPAHPSPGLPPAQPRPFHLCCGPATQTVPPLRKGCVSLPVASKSTIRPAGKAGGYEWKSEGLQPLRYLHTQAKKISASLTCRNFNKYGADGVQGTTGKPPGRTRRHKISCACKNAREDSQKGAQQTALPTA